jgi:hypothetical protein
LTLWKTAMAASRRRIGAWLAFVNEIRLLTRKAHSSRDRPHRDASVMARSWALAGEPETGTALTLPCDDPANSHHRIAFFLKQRRPSSRCRSALRFQ